MFFYTVSCVIYIVKPDKKLTEGFMIALEGVDGSGKSLQAKKIAKYLSEIGFDVLLTKEPTNGGIGKLIRRCLIGDYKAPPERLQMLFAADRLEHLVTTVEPQLKEGKVVVCDRYILSSFAYGSLDVELAFLERINSGFRWPDITVILDVPAEECIRRIRRSRSHVELFEKAELLQRVRDNFILFAKRYPNVRVIDGNRSEDAVFEDIKMEICLGGGPRGHKLGFFARAY
jgi:dTMP kinase